MAVIDSDAGFQYSGENVEGLLAGIAGGVVD